VEQGPGISEFKPGMAAEREEQARRLRESRMTPGELDDAQRLRERVEADVATYMRVEDGSEQASVDREVNRLIKLHSRSKTFRILFARPLDRKQD
jgi:hypothetical protein